MTANELYVLGLSLLPANPSEDDSLSRYVVGWVNLAMRETFSVENSIRAYNNDPTRPVLEEVPRIETIEDVIPYSDELVGYAFPYFLASFMCKDDDDNYWAQDYRSRYIVAVSEATRLIPGSVVDVYKGDET